MMQILKGQLELLEQSSLLFDDENNRNNRDTRDSRDSSEFKREKGKPIKRRYNVSF